MCTIAKPSLVSWVKGQAGTELFGIFCDIVIHNGHSKGELTHTIIEWAQTEGGEVAIVTRGYRWMKCELSVCLESLPNEEGGRERVHCTMSQ